MSSRWVGCRNPEHTSSIFQFLFAFWRVNFLGGSDWYACSLHLFVYNRPDKISHRKTGSWLNHSTTSHPGPTDETGFSAVRLHILWRVGTHCAVSHVHNGLVHKSSCASSRLVKKNWCLGCWDAKFFTAWKLIPLLFFSIFQLLSNFWWPESFCETINQKDRTTPQNTTAIQVFPFMRGMRRILLSVYVSGRYKLKIKMQHLISDEEDSQCWKNVDISAVIRPDKSGGCQHTHGGFLGFYSSNIPCQLVSSQILAHHLPIGVC